MATLNSIEIPSIASGTYESLTLPTAGTWFIKPRCQKYKITGRLSESADSLISQDGAGLNVKVSQADAPLTIYLQADCAENTTAKADYSDFFFEVGAGGEGGGSGQADVVKLTGDQSIGGNKVFTSKVEIDAIGEVLKLKNSATSNYIAGYQANTRIYYIGKDSSSSDDLSIKNEVANGWITLKTQSKFDQAYAITDNNQIVHKKYIDDTCVKLTGNQTIGGIKVFTDFVDVDAAPHATSANNYCMLRFVGDKWSSGQTADLFRFHKSGPVSGYKVYLNGTVFNYAEIYGLTLISNMKDPTADTHGANKNYVDVKKAELKTELKTELKQIVANSTDFNDFKSKMQNW